MRPIKMKMQAFGPYSNIEIVDFQELNNKNLFLITGPTGAGKTTIFDALAFAMYGEASGNMRSIESLRSQFAPDELLTEVELDFELRGTRYNVHRIPKQQKQKSRGEGLTEQKPEATLVVYEEDEKEIYTGVKTVNDEIEKRIGINSEQFRQIMMIPQGEFRKLLTSSSEEREKVLKKLFDTKIYNDIQYKLENEAKVLYSEIKIKRELRDHEISKIESDNREYMTFISDENNAIKVKLELLETIIGLDVGAITSFEKEISSNRNQVETIIKKQEVAKGNNSLLDELKDQALNLKALENSKEEMSQLDVFLKKGTLALQIMPVETSYDTRRKELEGVRISLAVTEKKRVENHKILETVVAEYKVLTGREKKAEIETLVRETNEHIAYIDQVEKLKDLEISCKKLSDEKENNQTSTERLKIDMEKQLVLKENLDKAILKSTEAKTAIEKIRNDYKDMKAQKNKWLSLNTLLLEKKKITDAYNALKIKDEFITGKVDQAEKTYKNHKMNYFLNQAAVLAEELKEGESCPVCGSKAHDKMAEFSGDMVTKEIVDRSESLLKDCVEKRSNHEHEKHIFSEKIEYINGSVKDLYAEIKESHGLAVTGGSESIADQREVINSHINETNNTMKTLENQGYNLKKNILDEEETKGLFHEYSGKEEQLNKQFSQNEQRKLELVAELSGKESIAKEISKVVPKEFLSGDALHNKIEKLRQRKKDFDDQLEKYRTKSEWLKEENTTLKTSSNEVEKQIQEFEISVKQLKRALDGKIKDLGFESYGNYETAKVERSILEAESARYNKYSLMYNEVKAKFNDLALKCKGIEPIDIVVFEHELIGLKKEGEQITEVRNTMDVRLKTNERLRREITKINEFLLGKEERYGVIGNLARIATGKNTARITFERYVLAAFLDDIIIAANVRLRKMSLGRFVMARTEALERKNKQSGLELEVFDNYTGKSRHVKTLSGGESFKASLSMALGLSDVVQSYAGGVQLDTMFIDEGFGTLDQESLDSAISCLIDLQKTGRLVGIISHVQELKERIDVRLEVTSTSRGSSTQFVTL